MAIGKELVDGTGKHDMIKRLSSYDLREGETGTKFNKLIIEHSPEHSVVAVLRHVLKAVLKVPIVTRQINWHAGRNRWVQFFRRQSPLFLSIMQENFIINKICNASHVLCLISASGESDFNVRPQTRELESCKPFSLLCTKEFF